MKCLLYHWAILTATFLLRPIFMAVLPSILNLFNLPSSPTPWGKFTFCVFYVLLLLFMYTPIYMFVQAVNT